MIFVLMACLETGVIGAMTINTRRGGANRMAGGRTRQGTIGVSINVTTAATVMHYRYYIAGMAAGAVGGSNCRYQSMIFILMTRLETGVIGAMTVNTTAAAAYCMTRGGTGQRAVCYTVNMTAVTGTIMNVGNHRSGMTRDTIFGTNTRQFLVRLRCMACTKVAFKAGVTDCTVTTGTTVDCFVVNCSIHQHTAATVIMQRTATTGCDVTRLAAVRSMDRADVLTVIICSTLVMTIYTGSTQTGYLTVCLMIDGCMAYVLVGMTVKTGNNIGCAGVCSNYRLNTHIAHGI
jgi:hypothetical protein